MKTCTRCKDAKDLDHFYPDASKRDGRSSRCRQCQKEASRERHWADPVSSRARMRAYQQDHKEERRAYYRRCKREMLEAYGGKCACCGESCAEFLTVDHVGGWGKDHRGGEGKGYAFNMVMYLKKEGYPQDGTFQLLCFNCNCSIGIHGYCPHQNES